MRIASVYGAGAAIGFSPQQINQMSMWQYFAALNGYIEAKSPKDGAKLSTEEAEDIFDWMNEGLETTRTLSTNVYLWDEFGPVLDEEVTFIAER